jgi:hypothetical protein
MLQILRQKYLLESLLVILMLATAIYARTRLPEGGVTIHAEREFLHR